HDFLPDPVDTTLLLRLLEFGTFAPNHRLTQPWRFIVIGPVTRRQLADISAAHAASSAKPGSDAASIRQLEEKTRNKLLAKPTVVAVLCRKSEDPVRAKEDQYAVAAAIQNIQLAAWNEGVGTKWSTGKVIRVPETADLLGVDRATEEIQGLLFFGQPAEIPALKPRKPLAELMRTLP
ncbi:MAG TPA: nitroreductase, partial [Gemmatimonadales bacterium]|nr:nitroreductase [Gemmatimonadales bacterium]